MINLDDRLLPEINEKELWLLTHIVKRLNDKDAAFPSNETLCADTKWAINTLQVHKKTLIKKGILITEKRFKKEGGQTSNNYKIATKYIKSYTQADTQFADTQNLAMRNLGTQILGRGDTQNLYTPPTQNLGYEVLTSLSINNCNPLSFSYEKDTSPVFSETLEDYEGELNTQTQKNEQPGEVEVITPKKEAKPKKEKTTKPQKILFAQTEFCAEPDGYQRFEAAMIARNKKYENYNLDYYYQAVQIWSEKGNYAVNWIATAAGFILRDDGEGKGKMKIVPMNGKPQSPDPNSDYYKNAPTLGYARDQK